MQAKHYIFSTFGIQILKMKHLDIVTNSEPNRIIFQKHRQIPLLKNCLHFISFFPRSVVLRPKGAIAHSAGFQPVYIILGLFLFAAFSSQAQPDTSYYRSPLDIPLSLSANFGELRPNHLHSGLDFRVGGVPGAKLYAVAEGYIARIVVRPNGFGNALYIQHPNGTISVYGHMDCFAPKIKTYVENLQYARQRFSIDVEPTPDDLPVKKGEVIGNAGNTGTSFGAHLHFEIRDGKSQKTLNAITHGMYQMTDNIKPTIYSVNFYGYRENSTIPEIVKLPSYIAGKSKQPVPVPDTFYMAVHSNDQMNGSPGKLGVYRLEVKLDKETIFTYRIDAFSFEESPYVNSLIDYEEIQKKNGKAMIKTYVEPGNRLSLYEDVVNHGLITLRDTNSHTLSIIAMDDYGNTATQNITVRKSNKDFFRTGIDTSETEAIVWNKENRITRNGLSLTIPNGALYRSANISIDTVARVKGSFSPTWRIHKNTTPLHKSMNLFLKADVPDSLQTKALVAMLLPNGGIVAAGGQWTGNGVSTNSQHFGHFFITVDTIAPHITPRYKAGADMRNYAKITFKITDNLSGIGSYNAYIDGEWALFEYDAKNNSLSYTFDAKRIKRNTKHRLQLVVTDNKQNTATLNTSFTW